MYTGKDFKIKTLWHFAKKKVLQTFFLCIAVILLYKYFNCKYLAIPFFPIGTIGTAVAFYVGFKNNQAYDRLWEARRLWGGIVNTSRNMATMLLSLVNDDPFVKDFLYRHIAYVNILRLQLRKTIPWATSKDELHQTYVSDSKELEEFEKGLYKILQDNDKLEFFEELKKKNNVANYILKRQIELLTSLKKEKK